MMKGLKVKKSYIYMILFLIIFTKPTFVDVMSELAVLNILYDSLRVFLMIAVPVYYIWKRDYSLIVILISILYVWLFASTYINKGEIRSIILTAGSIITCSIFADLAMKKDKKSLMHAVESLFYFYIITNFVTMILFPHGWFQSGEVNPENWVLGNKNLFVMYHIPYLFCVFQNKAIENRKLRITEVIGIIITLIVTLMSGSATGITGIAVFFIIYYLKEVIKKAVTAFSGLITATAGFVLIVIMNLGSLFSFIIVSLLHRDLTLTVRTYIWSAALKWFQTSPIYGVGIQSSDVAKQNMFRYFHPHCTYLYYLVFGGIIGLAIFVIILYVLSKRIDMTDKKLSTAAVGMFWAILIIYITEVYSRPELFFVCFVISWHMCTSEKQKKHKFRFLNRKRTRRHFIKGAIQ